MVAFSSTSEYRLRRPRLFRRHQADRAPERIRRHCRRSHQEKQTFFFANYDGYRYVSATVPGYQSIPTTTERTGRFQRLPSTDLRSASATGTGRPHTVSSNVIPQPHCRFRSLQSYLPAPTNGNIQNHYLRLCRTRSITDAPRTKSTYNLSDNNRLFGLFSTGKYAQPIVGSLTRSAPRHCPCRTTDGRGVNRIATLAQVHDSYGHQPGP